MTIFSKFASLASRYDALKAVGSDPLGVRFDEVLSATQAVREGRTVLLFGTNNYLGLTFDADGIKAATDAIEQFGTGTTGSRIANGTYAGHQDLERDIARFLGRRGAMVFSTGYQANLGILSTVVDRDDILFLDADSHASIYDGARLGHAKVIRFRHNNPDDLARRLRLAKDEPGNRLIVVEGLYSMLGDTGCLREMAAVKRETGAYLMVDEAHSLGVYGAHGRGLAEAAGVEADVDFVVGTFSKSLGTVGGFCASDHPELDLLRIACRPYMFTASLPPSIVASAQAALRTLQASPRLRQALWSNARRLYTGLSDMGLTVGPEASPVIAVQMPDIPTAVGFWNALLEAGIYVNLALPPATPTSFPLLRCSLSAAHSDAEVDAALEAFETIGRQMGLIASTELRRVAAV